MPMAAKFMMREERPKLMRGKGTPLAGPNPRTMEMLRKAWTQITSVKPAAVSCPARVGARAEIASPRHKKAKKSKRIVKVPRRPNSSPRMA